MKRNITLAAVTLCLALVANSTAQDKTNVEPLARAIARVPSQITDDLERDKFRTQLGRSLREQIAAANRTSSAAWAQIDSREDWEQFRREKLAALRRSLGELPPRPAVPRSLVTGRIAGDGFQIHNLAYESQPGLVVTANLYVPPPPREKMPGIVLSHSHHNPKEQG